MPLALLQAWTFEPNAANFDHTIRGLEYRASNGWPFPYKTTYRSFHLNEITEVNFKWSALQTNVVILWLIFLACFVSLAGILSQSKFQIIDIFGAISAIAISIVTYQRCQLWTRENHWSSFYGTTEVRPNYPDWPFWIGLAVLGLFVYATVGFTCRRTGKRGHAATDG